MKRNLKWLFVIIPIIIIVVFIVIACNIEKTEEMPEIKKVEYTTTDGRTTFTFNETFKNKQTGDYDLYATKDNKQVFGAFVYNLNEYEENSSKEILDKQINYFISTRKDMKIFKKEKITDMDDKIITTIEYIGKGDKTSSCIYIFSVIDFKLDNNYVVYTNEVILEDDYEVNIKEMTDILESAKLN